MDITYTDEVDTLVVTRTGRANGDRVYDRFTGARLTLKVEDNGALTIFDGGRAIAAYSNGQWTRVTPETKKQ